MEDRSLKIPKRPAYSGLEGWEFLRRWVTSVNSGCSSPAGGEEGVAVLRTIEASYQVMTSRTSLTTTSLTPAVLKILKNEYLAIAISFTRKEILQWLNPTKNKYGNPQ